MEMTDEGPAGSAPPPTATTQIVKDARHATIIAFLHTEALEDQEAVLAASTEAAARLRHADGALALNVLRSTDGSRVVTYQQWATVEAGEAAQRRSDVVELATAVKAHVVGDPTPRAYSVVYTDDRSPEGISVISLAYAGAIFINEITTEPRTQHRLLELVIANNEIQSQRTAGYRSANFHRSIDGLRAVNYSLWDTQEHCIQAISAMADMDQNLEETVAIANPDFRFYTVAHAWHASPRRRKDLTMSTYPEAVQSLRDTLTPGALAEIDAVYVFHFSDGTTATLDATGDQPRGYVEENPATLGLTPDFEVTLSRDDFAKLITGELHPMAGMATGRMKLKGSMRQAIKLDRVLKG